MLPVTRSQPFQTLREVAKARIDEETYRGFSARTGVPMGRVRSVLLGRDVYVSTVALLCRALGLEFYIGEPRNERCAAGPAQAASTKATRRVPVWNITDDKLWALIGSFADEWEAADGAGREKLEIRFAAQFPELVRSKRGRRVKHE